MKLGTGKIILVKSWCLQTQTLDTSQKKFGTTQTSLKKTLGMVLNKNIHLLRHQPNSQNSLLDGQTTDIQELKVLTIVQLVRMFLSGALFRMLTTKRVFLQAYRFQALTLKSCQDNGSTRLGQLEALKSEISFGFLVGY